MAELYALQEITADLKSLGFQIFAITPQMTSHSASMVKKQELDFSILSDPGNAYAAELGLKHNVEGRLKEIYQGFGIHLDKSNGEPSWTLPMPGRIIVDRDGIVKSVDADPDYTRRPEPAKTLEDARALADS